MTTARSLVAALVVLAVVLAGAVVLRPTGTTLAAWSDEVVVTVPTLRTGEVQMDVTTSAAGAATVGMAGDVTGTWSPTSVSVAAGGHSLTARDLAGSRVEYRLAESSSTCEPGHAPLYTATFDGSSLAAAVTGGEQLSGLRTLCLTFVPSDAALVRLGGLSLSFATSLDGVVAASTWTASEDWEATQALAPAPSIGGPHCSQGFLNQRVTLRWDWDRAGLSQDVARWSLQIQDGGRWSEVRSLAPQQRSVSVTPYAFDFIRFDTYTLRVAAVLPDGTTVPSPTTGVRVERIGIGAAYCA